MLATAIGVCGCPLGVVLLHDYAPALYTNPRWSELSRLSDESDVQATLTANLIVGSTSISEVVSFLAQEGVEACAIYTEDGQGVFFFLDEIKDYSVYSTGDKMVCSTPTLGRIINPENPFDIRGYNLFTMWTYAMQFHFQDGVLVAVNVQKTSVEP